MAGPTQSPVSNVSDTARWVATYRAWESARPDALFHDPFAARLAGEKGVQISKLMPRQAANGWPIIARTKLIDDLIADSLRQGCRRVVNLAAGLDTRPYRLALPSALQWIEVDLPGMIDEKSRLLAAEQPVCQLTRRAADLGDASSRKGLFEELFAGSDPTLVLTEGLLVYLDEPVVRALSAALTAQDSLRWWILDVASPDLLRVMQQQMGTMLERAPMKFGPPDGVAYFEAFGWRATEVRSLFRAAADWRRLPWFLRPFSLFPDPNPRRLGRARWSAIVRLQRATPSV